MKKSEKILQAGCVIVFALNLCNVRAQVPGVPMILGAAAGDATAYVSFSPPVSSGGSAIDAYTATCTAVGPPVATASGLTSPLAVSGMSGLVNNTPYVCSVFAHNSAGNSALSATVSVTPSASASLTLLGVKSRKTHGTAGVFDVPINNMIPIAGAVSVEPRAIGAGHRIVFQFNATVSSIGQVTVTDDTGAPVASVPTTSGNEVLVTFAALPDNKRVTVSLQTVNGIAVNASASIGFMVGDVNGSRSVSISDVSNVKSQSGRLTTGVNFRADFNTTGVINAADISTVKSRRGDLPPPTGPEPGTILFATQVPMLVDFAGRLSTFGNHRPDEDIAPRGGDLMIRYPDGLLRFLTREAGYGVNTGFQGATSIAVRDPAVHWSGNKAVFSMIVGSAPAQFENNGYVWQLYEVSGLKRDETPVVTKVPNQPTIYNNLSPIYGTDDRIIFTSDRPHNGLAHLYPQRDEYESTSTNTGLFSLNPATGDLKLLNHAPSGAFSPSIDSFGRLIFTRWDHLLRDQQAAIPDNGAVNFASEALGAAKIAAAEIFPEDRSITQTVYGPVNRNAPNFFTPWQINEDGTDEETLNHVGRHELSWTNMKKTFINDTALSDETDLGYRANQISLSIDNGGLFHLREDPLNPGTYFSIASPEFGTLTADRIMKLTGAPSITAESMVLTNVTVTQTQVLDTIYPGGRFRTPLPTTLGTLIASHTPTTSATPAAMNEFRLRQLTLNPATGLYVVATALTSGINKSVTWWDTGTFRSYNGPLWELEPVEVRVRQRPVRPTAPLESPEASVFAEEGVTESVFRTWMRNNNLSLIVTRDQTSRDRADLQQPFNLRVPGGVMTIRTGSTGRVYDIAHFQIFQGDLIRGYDNRGPGRRVLAQISHDVNGKNIPNPGGPPGSVKIALDGSTAAFVPARRALSWQSTDPAGVPIVRERFWITTQPGEIRVCASCHGANTQNQAGSPGPTNKPEALRELLRAWKLLPP